MGSTIEIAPNVVGIEVGDHGNVVYLVTGARAAFIDSGHDADDEVDALVECWNDRGRPEVAAIVLTHRHLDHAGGAAKLAERTGGTVVCAEDEREHIETQFPGTSVGRAVADGEVLDLGGATLEIVHTPGHTMGSLCVYYREERVLFTGDTVLASGTTTFNPEQGDVAAFLESLDRLLGYDVRLLCPGHGPVVTDARAKIRETVDRRHSRERDILGLMRDGPRTVPQLFQALYPGLEQRLHEVAHRQIRAHLVKLTREGKVNAVEGESFALT